jgi:hypothetical protein
MQKHLTAILQDYYDNFPKLREEHSELDNLSFYSQYGLSIQVPKDWDYLTPIWEIAKKTKPTLIIYSSTHLYDKIKESEIKDAVVQYCSWHEIYYAMSLSHNDTRLLNNFKQMISRANLVIFIGAPTAFPDVLNQVRSFADNCLLVFFG